MDGVAVADKQALNELEQTEVALEIAKDSAITPEEARERDELLKQIRELKKRLDETTGERDKFKKERDEANANLHSMSNEKAKDEKSEFDELFGGLK